MENNGENSGPLTSLPVDRLTETDSNAAARANTSYKSNLLLIWVITSKAVQCTVHIIQQLNLLHDIE